MGGVVILPLDPGPEAAVERLEAVQSLGLEVGEPAGPQRPEEALDLALPRWLVGPGVDQRDAELRTDQGELAGAIGGPIIDVEARRNSAADKGVLEHRQEGLDVLGQGEGGKRDDAGGVVDEGDEVGLAPGSAVSDLGPVHDVAHPQLAGLLEGEAAAVGAVRRLLVEQALAAEEPMHGGRGERMIDTVVAGLLDDPAHRPCRIAGLQLDELRGDLGRQPPRLPPVGARLGVKRVEAAVAVALDPPPDRVGGDMGPVAPGDGVGLAGLVAQLVADAPRAHRQMHQIGDDGVSEERDLLAKIVV